MKKGRIVSIAIVIVLLIIIIRIYISDRDDKQNDRFWYIHINNIDYSNITLNISIFNEEENLIMSGDLVMEKGDKIKMGGNLRGDGKYDIIILTNTTLSYEGDFIIADYSGEPEVIIEYDRIYLTQTMD